MQTFEQALANHAFFKGLGENYLLMLSDHAKFVELSPEQYIFHQGEEADRFFLVLAGKIALEVSTMSQGPMTIETIGPDGVLGWSWNFPPFRWHFDARAVEPTTAIVLDGKWLRQECKDDPELGQEVIQRLAQVLVQRLQATRLQLLDVYGVHF